MDGRPNILPLPFPPPAPEFDDFIEGENRQILSAMRALTDVQSPLPASSVYVWSGGGGGKTHLLRMTALSARTSGHKAFYTGAEQDIPPPMPGLLAADDIGAMSEQNRLILFDWQNKIQTGNAYRIVAAGSAPPAHIGVGEEIAARLSAGLVFRLREISETEKRRALSRYAAKRSFDLPEQIIDLFITRLPRDMTSLIAALSDLDNYLITQQKPMTLPLVRKWLRIRLTPLFDE